MPRGAKPKQDDTLLVEKVRALYLGGSTQAEVARLLGLTQKSVFGIMRRNSIVARVAAKRDQFGARNHAWKGDDASKYAFHRRLYSRFGKPSRCSQCGTTEAAHYDYANLSGLYEDLNDYAPMCRSCHSKYDDKILNISHVREARHG